MSTPVVGSDPGRRLKENCETLTPTHVDDPHASVVGTPSSTPMKMRVAIGMRGRSRALETNGNDREARTLHSITLSSSFFAISCMLKGPEMKSAWATAVMMSRTPSRVASVRSWAGETMVASPECTPAFSTCSEITHATTLPSFATASTSISLAFSMNLEMTTGCSLLMLTAGPRKFSRSSSLWHTFIAAPESTYEGRMRHGYDTLVQKALAEAMSVTSRHCGWSIPSLSSMRENL
mmetsp:Transcript_68195/g.162794  ORF Transcript_68195/g.162794 Transcript_68195/m.162794 type:complete len:236 (+) Transcript_68195:2966-3673(+)